MKKIVSGFQRAVTDLFFIALIALPVLVLLVD